MNAVTARPLVAWPRRILRKAARVLRTPARDLPVRVAETDLSLAVPFAYSVANADEARIAVIVHLFHAEMADEFAAYLLHVGRHADVYVSTDDEAKRATIRAAFAGWPPGRVEIRIAPNRGRDIAPKFVTFADVYPRYDLVLCVHSKKTDFSPNGAGWREKLLRTLSGSAVTVASIRAMFALDPSLGLLFPQHHEPIREYVGWQSNFDNAARLAARMGIALDRRRTLDIASGSMFWARPAALRPLLDLKLALRDFPAETGQIDGTTAHAVERLLLFSCERAGFAWDKIADPLCYDRRATIVAAHSEDDVRRFLGRDRLTLLGPRWREAGSASRCARAVGS